jgi:hypothetical protein
VGEKLGTEFKGKFCANCHWFDAFPSGEGYCTEAEKPFIVPYSFVCPEWKVIEEKRDS